MISPIIHQYKNTGVINDVDLDTLMEHYITLIQMLEYHGDIYKLVKMHAVGELDTLERFKNFRGRD